MSYCVQSAENGSRGDKQGVRRGTSNCMSQNKHFMKKERIKEIFEGTYVYRYVFAC